MTLNPYDLCPNCGGRGLIGVGISDINAICPECDGSGNGETTRLRDRIATLEKRLAAVPKWIQITDDPATWPQDVPMVDVIWWDGDRPHLTTCAILRHRIQYLPTHGAWMLAKPETADA